MKNNIRNLIFFSLAFGSFFQLAHASDAKINAGMLQSVWYSSISISGNDQIRIFGAIQNHSSTTFSGTAVLYIDKKEGPKIPFVSKPDTLEEISGAWSALEGSHSMQFRIEDASISTSSLLSAESKEASISVNKVVTVEDITKNVTEVAVNTVNTIDTVANSLADKVESMKNPAISGNLIKAFHISGTESAKEVKSTNVAVQDVKYQDAGTTTKLDALSSKSKAKGEATVFGSIAGSQIGGYIYNAVLSALALILRNWKIAVAVIALLLVMRLFRRKKE
ncbi:MAG: hypothetical protein WC915_04110 [archaeon]|jgi:hypothetical protein